MPRITTVGARREQVRRQHFIERIDHLRDFQILDLIDRDDEVAPEIAQHVAPRHLIVGNEVELFFETGGEIVLDVSGKKAFEEGDDDASAVLGMQPLLCRAARICGP